MVVGLVLAVEPAEGPTVSQEPAAEEPIDFAALAVEVASIGFVALAAEAASIGFAALAADLDPQP